MIKNMQLTKLTPLELNKFRFSGNHTPLTPEQIDQLRKASKKDDARKAPSI